MPTKAAVTITPETPETPTIDPRVDQLMDLLLAQQEELATLKAAQTGEAAGTVAQHDATAALDAELAALKAEFSDYPLIEVFERRMLTGVDAPLSIRLQGEPPPEQDPTGARRTWHLRWFNFGKEGRAQQAASDSYQKVLWSELQDQESVGTGTRTDPYVRKGDRGLDVLHKIPLKMYRHKQRRKAALTEGLLQSESRLRDHLANSVADRAGAIGDNADRAGSFASRSMSLTITPGETERFTA